MRAVSTPQVFYEIVSHRSICGNTRYHGLTKFDEFWGRGVYGIAAGKPKLIAKAIIGIILVKISRIMTLYGP